MYYSVGYWKVSGFPKASHHIQAVSNYFSYIFALH